MDNHAFARLLQEKGLQAMAIGNLSVAVNTPEGTVNVTLQ